MRTRRILIVLFPIALPVWLALLFLAGLVAVLRDFWLPLRELWNAPPKRMSDASYYAPRTPEPAVKRPAGEARRQQG